MHHKHIWKKNKRKHGRPGRFFVVCECGVEKQACNSYGHLKVFDTSVDRGGVTRSVSFRLDLKRFEKMRKRKVNVRKVIEKHVDGLG
jgi:hypothetical protein